MELFDGTKNLQIRFHIFLLRNTNLRNTFIRIKTAYEREMCVFFSSDGIELSVKKKLTSIYM